MNEVAAAELTDLCALLQAKHGRLNDKEKDLHQTQVKIAEVFGAATVRLRLDAESLLRESKQELEQKLATQQRRLEALLQQAQDELRKALVCRKEVKTLKESLAASSKEQERLARCAHDARLRCKTLADKEREHRQVLQDERDHWEAERQQLQLQQKQLHRRVQQLEKQYASGDFSRSLPAEVALSSASTCVPSAAEASERLPWEAERQHLQLQQRRVQRKAQQLEKQRTSRNSFGSRSAIDSGHIAADKREEQFEQSVPRGEYTLVPSMVVRPATPSEAASAVPAARVAEGAFAQKLLTLLFGAWWGLDCVLVAGSRGLWGTAVLLADAISTQEVEAHSGPAVAAFQDVSARFLRHWAWRTLIADLRAMWEKTSNSEASACKADPTHNALAWAWQCHSNLRSSKGSGAISASRIAGQEHIGPIAPEPFDLTRWPPRVDGPFGMLHGRFAPGLSEEPREGAPANPHLAMLEPAGVQRRFAGVVWQDVRRQLLASEQVLRDGKIQLSVLTEIGRSLLVAVSLLQGTNAEDAHAALRALVQLCASHAEMLREGLHDALPVLLWLLHSAQVHTRHASEGVGSTVELVTSLFQVLAQPGPEPAEAASFAAAALLRLPSSGAPGAHLVAQLLERATAANVASGGLEEHLRALRPRLRQWLQQYRVATAGESTGAPDAVTKHLEEVFEIMDAS